uniref:Uncharacterized protein n=1 Tax=Glossina pallidipes TaxID=7398 RepID=A0A1A9Z472_GLOPL
MRAKHSRYMLIAAYGGGSELIPQQILVDITRKKGSITTNKGALHLSNDRMPSELIVRLLWLIMRLLLFTIIIESRKLYICAGARQILQDSKKITLFLVDFDLGSFRKTIQDDFSKLNQMSPTFSSTAHYVFPGCNSRQATIERNQ